VGFALGTLYYRWINSTAPEPTPNAVVVPSKPEAAAPDTTTTHHARKIQNKATSKDEGAQ